jgi:surface antigen
MSFYPRRGFEFHIIGNNFVFRSVQQNADTVLYIVGRHDRVESETDLKIMRIAKLALAMVLAAAAAGCSTGGTSAVPSLAFGAFPHFAEPADKLKGATLVSALNGGIIDPDVNERMDPGLRNKALQAEYQALEYTPAGQAVAWGRSGGRFSGEVVASQPYRVGSQDCRQYTHSIIAEGTPVTSRGAACRNSDGSWTPLT